MIIALTTLIAIQTQGRLEEKKKNFHFTQIDYGRKKILLGYFQFDHIWTRNKIMFVLNILFYNKALEYRFLQEIIFYQGRQIPFLLTFSSKIWVGVSEIIFKNAKVRILASADWLKIEPVKLTGEIDESSDFGEIEPVESGVLKNFDSGW